MGNAQQAQVNQGSEHYTLVYSLKDVHTQKTGAQSADWTPKYVCFSADRTELLIYRETSNTKFVTWWRGIQLRQELKGSVDLDPGTTHIRPMVGKFQLHEFCIGFESNCSRSKVQQVLGFTSKKLYLRWVRAVLDVQHRISTAHAEGFTMLNGNKYYGQRQGLNRHGSGSLTTPGGAVMHGSWEEDLMEEHASIEYTPTLLYDGCVRGGVPHGIGKVSSSGQVAVGRWEHGEVYSQALIAVDRGTGRFCGIGASNKIVQNPSITPLAGMWSIMNFHELYQHRQLPKQADLLEVTITADTSRMDHLQRPFIGRVHFVGDHDLPYDAYFGDLLDGLPHGRGWVRLNHHASKYSWRNVLDDMTNAKPLSSQIERELHSLPDVVYADLQLGQMIRHTSVFLAALRLTYGDEARLQAMQEWITSARNSMQPAPLCIFCQQSSAEILFDCNHCMICWTCGNQCKECPACRQQTSTVLKTYYS